MRRGRLPLTALRSFESAGRLLSFTQAAEELFVTQAAISRQIRELERSLGLALFERHHRSVSLTENGAHLLARLTRSFDAIDDALRHMIPSAAATALVVSAEPVSRRAGWCRVSIVFVPCGPRSMSRSSPIRGSSSFGHRAPNSRSAMAHRRRAGRVSRRSGWREAWLHPCCRLRCWRRGRPCAIPRTSRAIRCCMRMGGSIGRSGWSRPASHPRKLPADPCSTTVPWSFPRPLRGHGVALGDLVLVKDDIAGGPACRSLRSDGFSRPAIGWSRHVSIASARPRESSLTGCMIRFHDAASGVVFGGLRHKPAPALTPTPATTTVR